MKTLAAAIWLTATATMARETEGVNFPETVSVEGKELKLNGVGVRTKTMFKVKVYVAGLYLPNPTHVAESVLKDDEPKRVRLTMLRDLSKEQIGDAIREGFERNAGQSMATLKPRLDKFISLMTNAKKGDQLVLTYVTGRGTIVADATAEKSVIEGKDFADALFSVWLGAKPVDDDLKKGLLAG